MRRVIRWCAVTDRLPKLLLIVWRTAAVGICALGVWLSWGLARADYLFRLDTVQSLQTAIHIEPDAWQYYMRLSLLDDKDAGQFLDKAVELNAYNAQADIELGLLREAAGDFPAAETLFLNAFAVDHTYQPRWSLANYYFRRGDLANFWLWARRAAEMPSEQMEPLFELCWHASPNANEITQRIVTDDPKLVRQYLQFLLTKDEILPAAQIAERLSRIGTPSSDNTRLFQVIDRLVIGNEGDRAMSLWNALIARKWVIAEANSPNNPNFARDPLPVSFDWVLPSLSGLHSWPGPGGLRTEFSGQEPENCFVAEQFVVLPPGNYDMDYSYSTDEIPPGSGLRWQIIAVASGKILAQSSDLSNSTLSNVVLPFLVESGRPIIRLRLQYQRAPGTDRISGTLRLQSVHIHPHPQVRSGS